MKLKRKHLCWGIGLLVVLCVSAGFYWWKQQPTVLHIGVYAGSSWDVPTSQRLPLNRVSIRGKPMPYLMKAIRF